MINRLISSDEEGSRLDRVLRKNYSFLSQARIESSLRKKFITINQKKVTSNFRVSSGDVLDVLDSLIEDQPVLSKNISKEYIDLVKNNIIFKSEDFIVLNKPSGLAVQGGTKIKISIDDIMPKYIDSLDFWFEEKPIHKLVHRLDKETSGILIIALNNKTAQKLASVFKEKNCQKIYYAILKGEVKKDNGFISSIIDKEEKQLKNANAHTKYKVLAKTKQASFLEFQPITGKNHQLRLHSLELGFPILGDAKYDKNHSGEKDLHLHAKEITFPFDGQTLRFEAPLPDYFLKSLRKLKLA